MEKTVIEDSKRENLVWTFFLWILFGGCAMAVMLYTAVHKTVVIANVQGEEVMEEMPPDGRKPGGVLTLQSQSTERETIYIPLARGQKAEDVAIENHYMERELRIYIDNTETSFYEDHALYGATDTYVNEGFYEEWKDGVVLRLQATGVYEYVSMMETDVLAVTCYRPRELYDRIVVIDPAGGEWDEGETSRAQEGEEITLQVARELQQRMEDGKYKLYFTRLSDADVPEEERAALADAVQADIYITLSVSVDAEHPERYGIQADYNEAYFIPDFGNVQLADILTRNVTIASGNRAVGLLALQDDEEPAPAFSRVGIPAARIRLGFLTNERESQLLGEEEYLGNLAEGLANAIEEVYTE